MDLQTAAQINGFLAAFVLLTAFGMLAQKRIYSLIHLFAWQGFFLSVNIAIVAYAAGRHHLYISSILTLSLKVILLPYILHTLVVKLKIRKEAETLVNIPATMLIGISHLFIFDDYCAFVG